MTTLSSESRTLFREPASACRHFVGLGGFKPGVLGGGEASRQPAAFQSRRLGLLGIPGIELRVGQQRVELADLSGELFDRHFRCLHGIF